MQIQESVDRLIARYGGLAELCGDPAVTTSALIQPLRGRDQSLFGGDYSKLGLAERRHFIYIGPARYSLTERRGGKIRAGEQIYRIIRAEDVRVSGKTVYSWGILLLEEEEEPEASAPQNAEA